MRFVNRIEFRGGIANAPELKRDAPELKDGVPHEAGHLKLRERYPFLNEPGTPVEMQALVTQRITRWYEYDGLYRQLRDIGSMPELSAACRRLLDAYLDHQAITREMDYYQQHRQVLGRHPYFRHFRQLQQLRSMNVRDLLREQEKTRNNIWRVGSEMRKGNKPHLDDQRRQKLQDYEMKLREINRLLGDE